MRKIIPFCLFTFILIFSFNKTYSQTVSSQAQLNTAVASASAGSTIILSNGTYNNLTLTINKNGTVANPITIKAENAGQVFIQGNSSFEIGGSYIIIEGFVFKNASNLQVSGGNIESLITFRANGNDCNNCTVTNIKIDAYNGTSSQNEAVFKWILLYGNYNEISHSSFIGKNGVGSIINDNRSDNLADYHKIHHNYFASRKAAGDVNDLNDQDAIRIGTSTTSLSNSFTEVYDNFFYDWEGEVEIISNKSGKNKYYNNTFRNYSGTLTLRHGNGCEVNNNFFFADGRIFSGGIRVIGEDHKIYNNYVEGISAIKPGGSTTKTTGAINVTNGRPNTALSGYYQVKNATIVNNTFVNCDYGVRFGTNVGGDLTLPPENIILANNIMLNTSENAFEIQTNPTGNSKIEGNITQNGSWDLTNGANNNQTVASGLLETGSEFYRIKVGSPAINAQIGSYSFLTDDILGGIRTSTFDAGAEEFSANGTSFPYKVADVGIKVGFLSNPEGFITTSVNNIELNINAGSATFDVTSNINWTVSDNANWLTLNKTSGVNSETVSLSVEENNSGDERTAIITISGDGVNISKTLTVNQSLATFDSNDAVAISGITVTGVGTQDSNIPENTIDGDFTTRWSANANDGSVYLTYDLSCKRTVTSVKIYFHKGAERTSSFKIATSNDGNSFTDATAILTSSGNTVGFEEFTLPSSTQARFIRILGFGNSEGSGWNSYEEVQIFGDSNCASLSVKKNTFKELGISVFPIPTDDNYLNINSQKEKIGKIEIFDLRGKSLLKSKIDEFSGRIDISNLSGGIYIIKIKDSFGRFIVN